MTTYASSARIREAVEDWTDAQIQCRAYQHNWRSLSVFHRPGIYTIVQRCTRCKNERERDMDESGGVIGKWKTTYRPGYLLGPNVGRVDGDGRDIIRLASLRHMTIIEVKEGE
jgi:hypothetical protein